jgi:hypothetical protein
VKDGAEKMDSMKMDGWIWGIMFSHRKYKNSKSEFRTGKNY